jgi:predicted phage-related endonuclease
MERGKRAEPVARSAYEAYRGISAPPACLQHPEYEWMRASVDGLCVDRELVVEIKNPGSQDHEIARESRIPAKYYPQIQHILAVSTAKTCDYWSYRNREGILVVVSRNEAYISDLIEKEWRFWKCVRDGVPPYPDEFPSLAHGTSDCPWCGLELVERKSIRGTFIGCSGYPDCHYTRRKW